MVCSFLSARSAPSGVGLRPRSRERPVGAQVRGFDRKGLEVGVAVEAEQPDRAFLEWARIRPMASEEVAPIRGRP